MCIKTLVQLTLTFTVCVRIFSCPTTTLAPEYIGLVQREAWVDHELLLSHAYSFLFLFHSLQSEYASQYGYKKIAFTVCVHAYSWLAKCQSDQQQSLHTHCCCSVCLGPSNFHAMLWTYRLLLLLLFTTRVDYRDGYSDGWARVGPFQHWQPY